MKLSLSQKKLREQIIHALKEQGFKINPHVRPAGNSKRTFRRLQQKSRLEQISIHKAFLLHNTKKIKDYCRDGKEINPEKISLELRHVQSGSFEEILFKWWNFIWWSIPYQRPYGRQMRFLLWDKYHDSPFGLIGLQSPVLKMAVRDNHLEIPNEEADIWVNRSMSAQRVGALPPYNDILGSKMVALSLVSNQIRKAYKKKYKDYISIIKGRAISPDLLFITTTSAFGRSSVYNRLKINNTIIAKSLGYTKGVGSFHISEELYKEILKMLAKEGIDVFNREFGNGPSKKVKFLRQSFQMLDLPGFHYHGIKREFFLFPLVKNLKEVINKSQKPIWNNYSLESMIDYWKERWGIPRTKRMPSWRDFSVKKYFNKVDKILI